MRHLLIIAFASFLFVGVAQGDTDSRITELERYIVELEQRIASLEARLTVPEPPESVHVVDGFTFARVGLSQSSSSYVGIVGEVTAQQDYTRVQIRFTLYSAAGAILGTGTVYVSAAPPAGDLGRPPDSASDGQPLRQAHCSFEASSGLRPWAPPASTRRARRPARGRRGLLGVDTRQEVVLEARAGGR